MFKEVGSGVGRVEDGGSESGAGELGENLVTESFAHLFKQYTLGQAVVDDAKLDHIFLVPEDLSV